MEKEINVIQIGTSKGIRLPAEVLKLLNSPKSLDMQLKDGEIVLKPHKNPREGWTEMIKENYIEEDLLILDDLDASNWDEL